MDAQTAIERAIAKAGSEAKLGELTGYSQVAINKAKRRRVSAEMAVAIEKAIGIPRAEFRPDLFEVAA